MFKTFLQTAVQSTRRDAIGQYMRDGLSYFNKLSIYPLYHHQREEKSTLGEGAQNETSNMKTCTTLKSILFRHTKDTYIVCVK